MPGSRLFVSTLLLIWVAPAERLSAAQDVRMTGEVIDASGRPVPRALVRVVDGTARERAHVFADERGRFAVAIADCDPCEIEASLTGFQPARVGARAATGVRLVLAVAPIAESVTVSATRSEVPTSQLGASVTVFGADEVARAHATHVSDLLRVTPGAAVVRSGGMGTLASVFVRGGESNYNKVLLDGIPLNEPGGAFNFSNLTTEHLDRVEIVRGAHSALFGSDAVASVIQLFTRRGPADRRAPDVSLAAEYGTYDTTHTSGGVAGGVRSVDYSVHAAHERTDNRAPNNRFRNTTVSMNAGGRIGSRLALRVIGRGELGRVGTPGATAFGRADLDAFFRRRDGVGGVTLHHETTSAWQQRWTYALAVSHQASTNLLADPPFVPSYGDRTAAFAFLDFPYDSQTDLRRHHLSHQSDWRLPSTASVAGEHRVTFVFDWDGERGVLSDRLASTVTRAERDNFGWTLQHQALWPRVFVTSGVRIEDNDSFGVSAVPRGSVAYLARPRGGALGETKLKASAGLGIKEPSFLQSFSTSPFFLGNPELKPERSRSVDVGIEQRFMHDRGKVELTWFDNRFRNLISTETLSFNPFRSQYFNVGRTRARGLEAAIEIAPTSPLKTRVTYTLLDSRVTRSAAPGDRVFAEGQWLFRRPRHSASWHTSYAWRRLDLTSNVIVVGRRVDSDFSALEPPLVWNDGYATWSLGADVRSSSRLRWFAVVENLTNTEYMEVLGYPALKRSIRAGVRVTF